MQNQRPQYDGFFKMVSEKLLFFDTKNLAVGLEIAEEITEDQEKGRQFDSISTLKIIPEASYDNQVVKCIVKHPELGKDIE